MKRVAVALALVAAVAGCSTTPTESGRDGASPSVPPAQAQVDPVAPRNAAAPPSGPAVDPADLAAVHEYTEMFYRGEIDGLFEKFSDELREILPLERLSKIHEHAMTAYGRETTVIAEDAQVKDDSRGFVRWARFDKTEEIIEIQWILRADDTIAGFFIRPAPKKVRAGGTLEMQR